jgi:hypothetical protein
MTTTKDKTQARALTTARRCIESQDVIAAALGDTLTTARRINAALTTAAGGDHE